MKKQTEATLELCRSAQQDRNEQLKATEAKQKKLASELEQTKTLIENGKKQLREYQEQHDAQKAKLDSVSQSA